MVPVMQRIHFSGLLATGADMQQIERFNRSFARRQANHAGFLRQAFGQVQKNFRLDRFRQR
ncbi:hypothetical protein D3C76_1807070 [compost metagenome]